MNDTTNQKGYRKEVKSTDRGAKTGFGSDYTPKTGQFLCEGTCQGE